MLMEGIHIKKMLVVEDDFITSQIARMAFESKGYRVDCVQTGRSALDKLGEQYDFILLDIGLPDIDGLEVYKKIRHSGAALAAAKMVVLTAHASSESETMAKELGANGFFVKPLTIEKCNQILSEESVTSNP